MATTRKSYRLDFSSDAWRQVGLLDRDSFVKLTNALCAVADRVAVSASVGDSTSPSGQTTVNGYVVRYQVDDRNQTVQIVDVRRAVD